MTPLETQLLNALRLRRATSFPFTPPPFGLGLARTEENGCTTAWAKRNAEADIAVDEAIKAGEAAEAGGWQANTGVMPVPGDTRVDVLSHSGKEYGGQRADIWQWHERTSLFEFVIKRWRVAV